MTTPHYSEAFKQDALQKVYQRKGRTIPDIANDLNMKHCTLKGWVQQAKKQGGIAFLPIAKRPEDWPREARLLALQQSHGLSEEALSAWCRQQGLFAHHLSQWRTDFCLDPQAKHHDNTQEIRSLKQANQTLERELARKEKALAEAAALLILQKKFHTLWEDTAK